MNRFRLHKRRAISEVVGTMFVLAATVTGAVFLSNVAQDAFFVQDQTPMGEPRINSISLAGYDARDSELLLDVPTLENQFNQLLCTSGANPACTITNPDNVPQNDGTEFIVLKIRNRDSNSVFLHNVMINNVGHIWNAQTGNNDFDASLAGIAGTTYPRAGQFSIINASANGLTQKSTNILHGDEEVRVIIKLSNDIPTDIGMWDTLRILVNFGGPQPAEFIVLSGDAKW